MPLIEATGTSVDRIRPDRVMKSIAPERTCDSMSVSEPSWLFGWICRSTRPLVSLRIASAAWVARTLRGWMAGRLLPNRSVYSALCANAGRTAMAPETAPKVSAEACDKNLRRVESDMLSPGMAVDSIGGHV